MYQISKEGKNLQGNINISGSKSESNRLLTLRAYTSFFNITNLSDSDDTNTMISSLKSGNEEINIGGLLKLHHDIERKECEHGIF